jgi:predicted nucleic acid-binding protein
LILVEAGPVAALVDADDHYHASCIEAFKLIREPLGTAWPALTEAIYLLSDLAVAQETVWQMLARGTVQLLPLSISVVPRIRELMRKHGNRPMDLANAATVLVAERKNI